MQERNRRLDRRLLAGAVVVIVAVIIVGAVLGSGGGSAKATACHDATSAIDGYRSGKITRAEFDARIGAAADRANGSDAGVLAASKMLAVRNDVDGGFAVGPDQVALAQACAT